MKFRVGVREVHIQWITVEAENAEEAVDKVLRDADTRYGELEFDHTLNEDKWVVREDTDA